MPPLHFSISSPSPSRTPLPIGRVSVSDHHVLKIPVWARAILLTTPTVATVGCSLTIPIAFLTDFALHGKYPNVLAIIGAFLVVGGFAFVSRGEPSSPLDNDVDTRAENDDDSSSSWRLEAAGRRRQQRYLQRTSSNRSLASRWVIQREYYSEGLWAAGVGGRGGRSPEVPGIFRELMGESCFARRKACDISLLCLQPYRTCPALAHAQLEKLILTWLFAHAWCPLHRLEDCVETVQRALHERKRMSCCSLSKTLLCV